MALNIGLDVSFHYGQDWKEYLEKAKELIITNSVELSTA
jgi:hypothetical protein